MNRFSDICSKLNHTPEWSNVYNTVNVRLQNQEFSAVTAKEVQIGKYLNTVSQATINQDVDEELSFARVTATASLEVSSLLNEQDQPTSLTELNASRQSKPQLYLT